MRLVFAVALIVHGLLHLLGFAKAFGFAELPQLTRPIPPVVGVLWLLAAVLLLITAGSLLFWPRWWWVIGACAITVSMVAIAPSWADAKFGALANLVVLAGVVFGFLAQGPVSLRAAYDRDVDRALARLAPAQAITDADLTPLPVPVRRYLRGSGVVGQPRVRNFRARMHGRIRSGPAARWMPFTAEQYNFSDEPARFFYMDASMLLVPVQGFHRYAAASAAMRVKAAALVRCSTSLGPR